MYICILYLQNVYYQSHRNPNLIAIVPVDEPSPLQQAQLARSIEKTEPRVESCPQGKLIFLYKTNINYINNNIEKCASVLFNNKIIM